MVDARIKAARTLIPGPPGPNGPPGPGFNFKGVLVDSASLPATSNTLGDAYFIDGHTWLWDGGAWQDGGAVPGDLTQAVANGLYASKAVEATVATKANQSAVDTLTTRVGAQINPDGTLANLIDEDDLASASASKVPSQRSVKAYVDVVKAVADRLSTQRYDVRQFGPVFTDDDRATFQAAIDAISAAGGGVLTGPVGIYVFLGQVTVKHGVHFDFPRGAHFDLTGVTGGTGAVITGTGTATALPALAANVSRDGQTITFVSAPDVQAGDLIVLFDSADFSFSPDRNYYRAGEFLRVLSVSETTVTTTTPTFAAYAAGGTVSAYKITPIRTSFAGFSASCPDGRYAIGITYGEDVIFSRLWMTGSNYGHIYPDRCYNTVVTECAIRDASPDIGLNYGIVVGNCQRLSITDCFIETLRHAVTHGGGAWPNGVPNREITISGGVLSSIGGSFGFDCHGNTEWLTITNVNLPAGATIAGDHITIAGCQIRSGPGGAAVYTPSELLGADVRIENNDILATEALELANPAVIRIFMGATMVRAGGVVMIRGNRIDLRGYVGSGFPATAQGVIYIAQMASAVTNDVVIEENLITGGPSVNGSAYAVYVSANTGFGFRSLVMNRNRADKLGYFLDASATDIEAIGNISRDAPAVGLRIFRDTAETLFIPKSIRVFDNDIERAWSTPMMVQGVAGQTVVEYARNRTVNNLRVGDAGSSILNVSIYIRDAISAYLDNNTYGFTSTPPALAHGLGLQGVSTVESNSRVLGGPSDVITSGTVTRLVDLAGPGAPAFVAAKGSRWRRTDGGAGTTLYINETGTSTWRAV